MKSKLYNQQNKAGANGIGLFPNYFKQIGIAVMVLAFLPAILVKATIVEIDTAQKETLKLLTVNGFLLGLLFVAWAKDKMEDKRTIALRLKSMSFSFFLTVCYVVLQPLTDWFFKEPVADAKAQELVLFMLLVYLFFYFLQKKAVHQKQHAH